MNKLAVTKTIANLLVGSGTTTITKSIIQNNVTPGNIYERVGVAAASIVIGSMAAEKTRSHTNARIDGIAKAWNEAKSKSKEDDTTVTA